jgi:hypothetical protein
MNKFEQLIEYVINDDESKARELFHDIVVEKSREIYENLMNEEEEELDEAAEEEGEELDESAEEELDEGEGCIGGDASDDLIDDVETEEQGMMEEEDEEGEEAEVEFGAEEGGEEDLEDRVVDLEDKLDELMAEFEAMMGGEEEVGGEEELEIDAGGDALEMDDTEEFTDEGQMGFMEGVDLKAAPKPVTSEEGGINTKSTVAANAGAKGPIGNTVKPVAVTGGEAKGRPAPSAKDLGGTTSPKQGPATKPVTTQASGVNTKSPVAKA